MNDGMHIVREGVVMEGNFQYLSMWYLVDDDGQDRGGCSAVGGLGGHARSIYRSCTAIAQSACFI